MKSSLHSFGCIVSILMGVGTLSNAVLAQITPDGTLSTTAISSDDLHFTIDGGDRSGNNLFHSFQEFSIPTGGSAFFNNVLDIENIFTRVTGNNISHIDGLLSANGTANLFVINPNGIQFGANASLNLGGSFFASTAESLIFEEGEFRAINPQTSSILTLNVPIGLQYGTTPASITVTGSGHNLTIGNFQPNNRLTTLPQLRVNPNQTLALLGGEILLEGGVLSSEGGNLELGAIGNHSNSVQVQFIPITSGWTLDYGEIENFADIQLNNQALTDASSPLLHPEIPGGSIQLVGDNIELTAGSRILNQNLSHQEAGEIRVFAAERLHIIGTSSSRKTSGIQSETVLGTGKASDIFVLSRQVSVEEGADILSDSFGMGAGGDVQIEALELIEIDGFSPINPLNLSGISANALGSGNAGNVKISTERLRILNRGGVASLSLFGTASSGDVTINATEIEISGGGGGILTPSGIATATGTSGKGGDITINTARLSLQVGGGIDSSATATGNAGNITISASESVEVSGIDPRSMNPSIIAASARIFDEFIQQLLSFPPQPSGLSGNITIKTPLLKVTDGAVITVRNDGIGDAGELLIAAASVQLLEGGGITASTESGEGGNITLDLDNLLLLRQESILSATATGEIGNGGNLNIDANLLVALQNSQIIANAVTGNGGNILITTTGFLMAPDTQIEASSTFGVDGVIRIMSPEIDNGVGLIALPTTVLDTDTQIITGCSSTQGDRFIVQGRGGVPINPVQTLSYETILPDFGNDLEGIVTSFPRQQRTISFHPSPQNQPIIEAQGWIVNEKGIIELVAQVPTVIPHAPRNQREYCSKKRD